MKRVFQGMTISALARSTGVAPPTIRYYEEIGLLPPATRSDSGQRRYDAADIERLTFIRRARDFGFSIEKVRLLVNLSISADTDCEAARDVTAEHLAQVRAKIADLQGFEATLKGFVAQCDAVCRGGLSRDCVVFSNLQSGESCGGAKEASIPVLRT